jgi:hypothetical protein
MSRWIVRTGARLLIGLALIVGVAWGAGNQSPLGEVVPDGVAAVERGGQITMCTKSWPCQPAVAGVCEDAPGSYGPNWEPCYATDVVGTLPGYPKYYLKCSVYCGYNGVCSEYATDFGLPCATTVVPTPTAITAP